MFTIREARESDVPVILQLIRELAEYEHLPHEATSNEGQLRQTLFGPRRCAEALIGELGQATAGVAVFFHSYSTFLGKPGLYVEDIYVRPEYRGRGLGTMFFRQLARTAIERGCGRMEWSVLNWNEPAIGFYQGLGAVAMTGWTVHRLAGDALDRLAQTTP